MSAGRYRPLRSALGDREPRIVITCVRRTNGRLMRGNGNRRRGRMQYADPIAPLLAMCGEQFSGVGKILLIGRTNKGKFVFRKRIERAAQIGLGRERQPTRCPAVFEKTFYGQPQGGRRRRSRAREIREIRKFHRRRKTLRKTYESGSLGGNASNGRRHT